MKWLVYGALIYGGWWLLERAKRQQAPARPPITYPLSPIAITVEAPFTDNPSAAPPQAWLYRDSTGQVLTLTKPRVGFPGFGA